MNVWEILFGLIAAFTCTVGFGICFGIRKGELYLSGIAGVLTRAVIVSCEALGMERFVYTLIAAAIGTLYAEIVARHRTEPIAKYVYPAVVLLIPGDILYKMVLAMIQLDHAAASANLTLLLMSLFGIALGCMLTPILFRPFRKK
ncbi:MAG: threonine/serine exporter family protein [Oscillospiraceae bacterium]|nr:threonine/serine exporter family protein [Oscillospiraceae bacterium]